MDETPHSYIELKVKEWDANDDSFIDNGWRIFEYTDDWEGSIYGGTGGGSSMDGDIEEIKWLPDKYAVKLNIGGVDMPDIIIEEVTD